MEYARDYAKDDDAINRLRMEVTKNRLPTYTIGVIAAYLRLCASLGKEFKKVVEAIGIAETKHYKNWIKYYAAQNFEAAVEQTENLLDKLSAPLTGNDFEILENLYRRTLELGVEVLSAQAISQPCITPLMRPPNSSGRRLLFFSAFDSTFDKFDYGTLKSFFEALAILDEELTTRVIASGLLRDLTLGQVKHVGWASTHHAGCIDFFKSPVDNNEMEVQVHVFSWTVNAVNIHGQDLAFDRLIGTAEVKRKLESSIEKLFHLKYTLETFKDNWNLTVYIMHNVQDLLCLLKANIGIVFNFTPDLLRTGLRL
ncbi:hypothetical protein CDL15_Pgr026148 [Punica granatum]|uniref:Thiaminase-2/PQQC domain-containing protein n=1 Tax=Punica granatum TaxID=22663 RepID=A0A218WCV7_PUNGR|nr:hypothetical protein CDL15_Pgr026148 [Punica granatum]